MTTYTAYFRTDADWASNTITAKTPEEALAREYDGGSPLNEIEITGPAGDELAVWRDDDLRLRLASRDMLEALELCEEVLSELARLDDGTPSISALHLTRVTIAKAKPPVA